MIYWFEPDLTLQSTLQGGEGGGGGGCSYSHVLEAGKIAPLFWKSILAEPHCLDIPVKNGTGANNVWCYYRGGCDGGGGDGDD